MSAGGAPGGVPGNAEGTRVRGRVLSAWNSVRYGWSVRPKTHFSKGSPLHLLGRVYSAGTEEDLQRFRRDFGSRLWLTYRRGFPSLGGPPWSTDCGWGCTLRSAQMLLAQGLVLHLLGRDWTWPEAPLEPLRRTRKPRDPQGSPRDSPGWTRDPQGVPRDSPGYTQDPQGFPQDPQGSPRDPPRWTRDPPRWTQDPQGVPQDPQGGPWDSPGWTWDPQGSPQDPPRLTRDPQGCPRDSPEWTRDPQGSSQDPQGSSQDPQGFPQDPQGYPQGFPQDSPGWTQDPRGRTQDPQGNPQDPQGYPQAPPRLPPPRPRDPESRHRSIISWFSDRPPAPFGIHRLVHLGQNAGKKAGDWFGPALAAHILRRAVETSPDPPGLALYVAQDCTVYKGDVAALARGGDPSGPPRAVIVLVPVRLGGDTLNPIYVDCLKELLKLKCCIGIMGGKPRHSLYFVGFQDDFLLYLDPHYCQPVVDTSRENFPLKSFHCGSPRKMPFGKMDPSCTIGFYSGPHPDAFWRQLERVLATPSPYPPIFTVTEGSGPEPFAPPLCPPRPGKRPKKPNTEDFVFL